MKTIWKYKLEATENQIIRMPENSEVLTISGQDGCVYVWALVDTDRPSEDRCFSVYGTGWEIKPENLLYIGTAFIDSHIGPLVFHVFERYEE